MKKVGKYILIFCGMLLCLLVLLFFTALIPQKSIKANSEKSAIYLNEKETLFYTAVKGETQTTIDNYADTILLNIAYSLDEKHPLKSALLASYYNEYWNNVNESYKIAVTKNKVPNKPYTRYWHGEMIFLKPLLIFMDVRGIRVLNAIVMIFLLILLGILLVKKDQKLLLSALTIAFVSIGVFIVPLCLEYTSTFFIMLVACVLILFIEDRGEEKLLELFFITGIITCFFDFLTTETITLTMPLIIVLCVKFRSGKLKDFKSGLLFSIKAGISWGMAYVLMWFAKWTISTVVLNTNTFKAALQQAKVRTAGSAGGSVAGKYAGAIFRNIASIFPFSLAKTYGGVILLIFLTAFLVFCIFFLYRKNKKNMQQAWFIGLLMLIGIVPYIRYIALSNHSYLHYFFTYRAQLVTVTVLIYAFIWSLDKKLINKRLKEIKSLLDMPKLKNYKK